MARRAWVIDEFRKKYPASPTLLLDSGNFSDAATAVGTTKTKALLEAMEMLGYQVVNVGERDVRYGYPALAARIEGSKLHFISSNIVDRATQKPVFEPHAIVDVTSADGTRHRKVGVIGAARFNPVFVQPGPDGKEMSIAHPSECVAHEMQALKEQGVDLVVLLAAMHRDDARRIAAEVPGIDFVVGAYGGVFTTQREQEGSTWILYSGNQGKRIGETRVFLDDAGAVVDQQTDMHLMTAVYPSDPKMLEFVNAVPIQRAQPTTEKAESPAPSPPPNPPPSGSTPPAGGREPR